MNSKGSIGRDERALDKIVMDTMKSKCRNGSDRPAAIVHEAAYLGVSLKKHCHILYAPCDTETRKIERMEDNDTAYLRTLVPHIC